VHECLALGKAVPLVVPFSNGADHCTIGQQLESRGLGKLLKPSELLRPGRLTEAVDGLLGCEDYCRRVAGVAEAWEQAGYGPKMAAELLIEFAVGRDACKQ
jgi:UDP:flavonoid glycosyltransferase YjiC (YdhE family)